MSLIFPKIKKHLSAIKTRQTRKLKKVTSESEVKIESAFRMQFDIVKNALLRTAFFLQDFRLGWGFFEPGKKNQEYHNLNENVLKLKIL